MTIGVVGAGTMGRGIAQVLLRHGEAVILHDSASSALESARRKIAAGLRRDVGQGLWPEAEKRQAESRLKITQAFSDFASAELVIEAVTENFDVKAGVFRQLDSICGPEAILASNTSSISITRLAAVTRRPQSFVGLHFFNPVPVMKLVEVVRGLETSEKAVQAVERLAVSVGKTPIAVKDSPGFVSNRLLMPMINEAIFALMEGVSDARSIDEVMRLGMHHPMGPLELADLIGLDVCLDIMKVLCEGFSDAKYRPCPLLEQMVSEGRLGRKAGKGFYEYPKPTA